MAPAGNLQIDPNTGLPIDPNTGLPIQQPQQQASPQFNSIYGSPQNAVIPGANPDPEAPMQNRYTQNQNIINALGNQINNESQYQMGYYGGLVPQYQSQIDQQLSQLQGTPGYTGDEASKIGIDYGQYKSSPEELAAITGNPQAAQQKAEQGAAGEGAMLNAYQANLGGQVQNYGEGVGGAVQGLKSGLEGAQDFGMLNNAVNSQGLNFDPNQTEKQLTDADVQNMKTAAGTRIGNQYRAAEDTLERQAAQAGNTSPLALAAARQRLMTQESADQGDSELNADIAAKQAQYQRAAGIEGQRLGSEQTKSGMQATAGTTEEAARQAAAGLAGQAGINAAQNIGQAGINAANQYGTTSIATQADIASRQANAANLADQQASDRAAQTAQMRYGQGTQTGQLTSQGAQTTGNARIAGQGALRQGIQGQEQFAQTGGNQAATQQNQAYGTQTSGLNSSASSQGNFINGKPSFGDSLASGFAKSVTGLLGAAEGDIINEPQTRVIGEKGPELVLPLSGRYRKPMNKEAA